MVTRISKVLEMRWFPVLVVTLLRWYAACVELGIEQPLNVLLSACEFRSQVPVAPYLRKNSTSYKGALS